MGPIKTAGVNCLPFSISAARLRDNPGEEVVTVMDGEEEDMREEEKEEWEKWLPLEGRGKVRAEHTDGRFVQKKREAVKQGSREG